MTSFDKQLLPHYAHIFYDYDSGGFLLLLLLNKFKITPVRVPQYCVAFWYQGVVVYAVLFSTMHVMYHFVVGGNWDIL